MRYQVRMVGVADRIHWHSLSKAWRCCPVGLRGRNYKLSSTIFFYLDTFGCKSYYLGVTTLEIVLLQGA